MCNNINNITIFIYVACVEVCGEEGMVEIVDLRDVLKNNGDMSLEEKFDYMVQSMADLQRQILALAKRIVAWRESGEAQEEAVEAITKSLTSLEVRKSIFKDILKGKLGMYDELFRKESNALKKYAKQLQELPYVV